MKKRSLSLTLGALFLALALAPNALAADITDVGYLDQAAVAALPAFADANQKLAAYNAQLQSEFTQRKRSVKSQADMQRLSLEFQQKLNDKQQTLLGPLLARAQFAIATVSATKKLSIVVDKRIIVYGGVNITSDVVGMLQSGKAIPPPTATPPPSEIGFVNQSALDGVPKVQKANADFASFMQVTQKTYRQKFTAAKTPTEQQAIAAEYNKIVSAKQKELLQPLVIATKNATSSIAKKKNLLLVIDRSDVVFGGTDITQDVQNAIGK